MTIYKVKRTGYAENRHTIAIYDNREAAEKRKRYEEYKDPHEATSTKGGFIVVENEVQSNCEEEANFEYRLVVNIEDEKFYSDWFDSFKEVHDELDEEEQFIREIISNELNEELEDWEIKVEPDLKIERKHKNDRLSETSLHGTYSYKEGENNWNLVED